MNTAKSSSKVVFTRVLPPDSQTEVTGILSLTAEQRTRTRYCHPWLNETEADLQLPRGTVLGDQDLLQSDTGTIIVRVIAQPEAVFTVTASNLQHLLRAAYHLGNRHVPLEVTATYLRLLPDPVLKALLVEQLQVIVTEERAPFCPEAGAYSHHG